MSRGRRIVLPGLAHHIVQRGQDRCAVFITGRDRKSHLKTLAGFGTLFGCKVYAYCLMTNHVHLIDDPGTDAPI